VGFALSIRSLPESYNALIYDYKVEPEEASVKLDGLSEEQENPFSPDHVGHHAKGIGNFQKARGQVLRCPRDRLCRTRWHKHSPKQRSPHRETSQGKGLGA
jgi:hypothetical protein